MASMKKVNEALVNLQSAIKILGDAEETFVSALDAYKEELRSESEATGVDPDEEEA